MTLAEHIQSIFIQNQWTLSLAESCTGGALAACLTKQPGCSQYFLGSIVAYSNELKEKVLGVDSSILASDGAVSGPVVIQMAQGVLELTGSDYSLAVSGIAGPGGGTQEKPVGTIWGAIARCNDAPLAWCFQFAGTREEIIEQSVEKLLEKLWLLIKN